MGNRNKYQGLDDYAIKLIRIKARQLVGTAGFVESDQEDLEQELALDLWRRLPRFDPAKGDRATFISYRIHHRAVTLIEAQRAGRRDFRRRATGGSGASGNAVGPLDLDRYINETGEGSTEAEERHDLALDLERFIATLPDEERDLCARLGRDNVSEISRETGVPRGTVYEAIGRLRRRFERAGLAEYL